MELFTYDDVDWKLKNRLFKKKLLAILSIACLDRICNRAISGFNSWCGLILFQVNIAIAGT